MKSVIGFPQYILNASKLDDRYKEVPCAVVSTLVLLFCFFSSASLFTVKNNQSVNRRFL